MHGSYFFLSLDTPSLRTRLRRTRRDEREATGYTSAFANPYQPKIHTPEDRPDFSREYHLVNFGFGGQAGRMVVLSHCSFSYV